MGNGNGNGKRNSVTVVAVPGWLKSASLVVSVLAVLGGGLWSVYDSRLTQEQRNAELEKQITELRGENKLLKWQIANGFDRVERKVDKLYDEFPGQMAKAVDQHEKHMHYEKWSGPASPSATAKDFVIEKPKVEPTPVPKDLIKDMTLQKGLVLEPYIMLEERPAT
jgi:hypothetical protein